MPHRVLGGLAQELGLHLVTGGRDGPQGGDGLGMAAFLDQQLVLGADQLALLLQVEQPGTEILFHQRPPDLEALTQDREDRLDLGNAGRERRDLFLLLDLLVVHRRGLGAPLRDLAGEEMALSGHQRPVRFLGRLELRDRIGRVREKGTQPRRVETRRHQIGLGARPLGDTDGRIKLDQYLARLDRLAILDVDRPYDAALQRLEGLGTAARDDLALRDGDDVDPAERRPQDRDEEDHNDEAADRPADRRWRCLDDLERRRQERELVGTTPGGPGLGRRQGNGPRHRSRPASETTWMPPCKR